MTRTERQILLRELKRLQNEVPAVQVKVDWMIEGLAAAQARVDEIEGMLASGVVTRTASADLGP